MADTKDCDRPAPKRTKLVLSDGSDDDDGDEEQSFEINEEFARRFEHNKKREERQRLEEKHGSSSASKRKRTHDDVSEDNEDDSTDESEDDDAELATEALDEEMVEMMRAIRNKDPRVYDENTTFYKEFNPHVVATNSRKRDKPMYLRDYHRQNLLSGVAGGEDENEHIPMTYDQEQEALRRQLVGDMHATSAERVADDGDFMVAKAKSRHEDLPAVKRKKMTHAEIEAADKDPELFLSNFMAARAWLPNGGSELQPFESDDSDDEARADAFEEAYNMRFEDPQGANEKLQSFARDVGKYGARREEKTGRKVAREREKKRKDAAKKEQDEEKMRLRKLKIEEAEEKVQRIKEAAGMEEGELDLDAWRHVIEGDFDEEEWEQEMERRFGQEYYAQDDNALNSGNDEEENKKRKIKKPKWDGDIDIKDLLPDFDDSEKLDVALSSDGEDGTTVQGPTVSRSDTRRGSRKQRRKIEEIVDASLFLNAPAVATASSQAPSVGFRYRETSPTSFGLSARDILFADDSQLNQYAGLKKMATFREEEKKHKDKKRFSKKGRLKQWRKETFGKSEEPVGGFETLIGAVRSEHAGRKEAEGGGSGSGKNKRKHKKKKKREIESTPAAA